MTDAIPQPPPHPGSGSHFRQIQSLGGDGGSLLRGSAMGSAAIFEFMLGLSRFYIESFIEANKKIIHFFFNIQITTHKTSKSDHIYVFS